MCETRSQNLSLKLILGLKIIFPNSFGIYKGKKIAEIANKFLSEGIYMCTFLPLSKVSAFDFMRLCLGLILPAYEFIFLPDEATKSFKDKIIIDSVTALKRGEEYEIQTKTAEYTVRAMLLLRLRHLSLKN